MHVYLNPVSVSSVSLGQSNWSAGILPREEVLNTVVFSMAGSSSDEDSGSDDDSNSNHSSSSSSGDGSPSGQLSIVRIFSVFCSSAVDIQLFMFSCATMVSLLIIYVADGPRQCRLHLF
jgi:hypothetical protein